MKKQIRNYSSFLLPLFCGIFFFSCETNDINTPVDCTTSTLDITVKSKQDVSSCAATDGTITVEATGGTSPYQYKISDQAFSSSGIFSNLGPGTFALVVKDMDGCEREITETILAANSTLMATSITTPDNQCLTNNGSITINATGGSTPYTYQLGTAGFGSSFNFSNINNGSHTVEVKDALGCIITVNVNVPRGDTGTLYSTQILSILQTNCTISGCHNGDNGANRNFLMFDNVKNSAANIRARTTARTMPPSGPGLSQSQIDLIACWVDDGAKNN